MAQRREPKGVLAHNRSLEASLLISQAAGIATSIVVSRTLGPTGRGLITTLTTWGQVLGWAAVISLDKAIIVLSNGPHMVASPDDSLRSVRRVVVALSVPAAIVTVAVGHRFFSSAGLIAALVVVVVATAQTELLSGWILAHGWREKYILWRLSQPLTYLVAAVIIAFASRHAHANTRVLALGVTAAASVALPVMGVIVWVPRGRSQVTTPVLPFLKFGVAAQTANLLQFLNGRLDVLALTILVRPRDVGLYVVAAAVGQGVVLLGTAGVVRGITGEATGRDLAGVGIAAVVALALAVGAPYVIPAVFGESFTAAAPIARILCAGGVLNYALQLACGRLLGQNRPWEVALAQGAGVAVFAAGIAAAPTVRGVAWASVISFGAALVAAEILLARRPILSAPVPPASDRP